MPVNVVQTFDLPITSLIEADTSFFFITQDLQLGVSDGTGGGTVLLNEDGFGEDYEGSNGRVFFDGFSSESGEEPFVNDGTPEGTNLLLDINPVANETSDPLNFISVGDVVYFTARDGVNGLGLYVSDGTPEGTRLVSNEIPNDSDFNLSRNEYIDFNGTLLFEASRDLWRSDGTAEGTQRVADFSGRLESFTTTDENLYFNNTNSGFWVSDGTPEGTELLLDTEANSLGGVGNTLYFSVNLLGAGNELWTSDGTPEGTQLLIDIFPERIVNGSPRNDSSNPRNLTDVNGTLFFSANDGVNGTELWTSDGTSEGTRLVADITEGTGSSDLTNFTAIGDTLYFFNEIGFNVNELWQSDGTAEGTFRVEPEEIDLGTSTIPSYQRPIELIELDGELYFTGQAYDASAEGYVPALLTVEEIDDSIVYRSFNPGVGVHFYTTDVAERDEFLATGNYVDEGASYRVPDSTDEGAEEVFRFFNETTGVHLYTTNEVERDSIQANLPDFTFEGTVFNAYETQVEGSIPVYRFFEPTIGVHLYTPSEVERESVEANLPNYNSEGIAYYALPLEVEGLLE